MAVGLVLIGWFGLALILYFMYKSHFPKNYEYMSGMVRQRGPKTYPVIGSLGPNGLYELTQHMHKLEAAHPSPMYAKLGPLYNVIVFDADSVEAVLSDNMNLRKGFVYDFLYPWFGHGLLTSYGASWHRQRKLLTPSFHFRILNDFVPIMNEASLVLIEKMREITTEMNGKPWDIVQIITLATLDIIMETSMGSKVNALEDPENEYVQAIKDFSSYLPTRISKPWLWLDPIIAVSPTGINMRKAVKILKDHSAAVIKLREESYLKERHSKTDESEFTRPRLSFLDHLLKLKHDGDIPSEEVQEQTDTFLFEGHDTTSHAIMWAMHCLATHIDVQAAIRKELDELLGDDRSACPTPEQITQMRQLDAAIKETLRLFPSVPMVSRQIDKDFFLSKDKNFCVPAGTHLGIDFYTLHRDPKHFPDPERFDPSRFDADKTAGRHPFCYVPFAGGPRNCIGQRFAMNEMRIVLCHMLRNFELSTTQPTHDTRPAYQMVLQPTNGIMISTRDLVASS